MGVARWDPEPRAGGGQRHLFVVFCFLILPLAKWPTRRKIDDQHAFTLRKNHGTILFHDLKFAKECSAVGADIGQLIGTTMIRGEQALAFL
jgi:hypothetical protein